MKEKILVTGGAGYIGSHVVRALDRAGYTPVVVDNLMNGYARFVKGYTFYQGDLLDQPFLRNVFAQERPRAVMHFAALNIVGDSYKEPQVYFENNMVGAIHLLKCMLEHDVKEMVFSSTAAVYGEPQQMPIPEDHPLAPINPYGWSKLFIEKMLASYHDAYGMVYASLRYFNAAGADEKGDIGEAHQPETHLIPLVLDVAMGKRPHITIFGRDYDTPDGTCIRDYIHVSDLAQAHLAAFDYVRGHGCGIFNLGSQYGYSVREIIDQVRAVTGKSIPVQEGERRLGDPSRLIAAAGRAKDLLHWQPRHSIEDMIASAWKWHQQRGALSGMRG